MKVNLQEMAESAGRQVGDWVMFRGAWGTQPPVECKVTGIGEKNGRLVYDNSLGLWGYADQYTSVANLPLRLQLALKHNRLGNIRL